MKLARLIVLPCALLATVSTGADPAASAPIKSTARAIPFDQIGAEAQKQYAGDGIAITPTASGARLRAIMQDLEGEATRDGLWLSSTADEDIGNTNRFRVRAMGIGRGLSTLNGSTVLPDTGAVHASKDVVFFVRPGLVEEYSVSTDGVRQDFIVLERPPGTGGTLNVSLDVAGANADSAPYGAKLTVSATGRELAYSRLSVTDATGRELVAHMDVDDRDHLRVVVEDMAAVYPVRIDPTFSDADWVSLNGVPGTSSDVYAVAADGSGNLYVGGDFIVAGNVMANRIAKWNGSAWSGLGSGMNDTVYSLAVNGNSVWAGGRFTTAGGVSASRVALWNGTQWSALGSGISGGSLPEVDALVVMDGDLYAGGAFTTAGEVSASRIAKWDGTEWSEVGGGVNSTVFSILEFDNQLYVGGAFVVAGGLFGITVNYIAKWDGTDWSALGSGMDNSVLAMTTSGATLYAGGTFTTAGGGNANRVAAWDGSTWSALGDGVGGPVNALALSGSDLYAGGNFTAPGGPHYVARWNGTAWSDVGTGTNSIVKALTIVGSDVIAGGQFTTADGIGAGYVARWNGSAWSALGSGINHWVQALVVNGGDLYAGGTFTTAGGTQASHVAKWNGSTWSALGSGLDGYVSALIMYDGQLYAGGGLSGHIARWDGTDWSVVGSGLNDSVTAFAVLGGDLYVAGDFDSAGGVTGTDRIARWDGVAWSALGSGVNEMVFALAVSGTDLYAGGAFTVAGGSSANRVAKWDGTAWSPLGSGVNDNVSALAVIGGTLYAGGSFTTAGGASANRIAKWDGSAWSELGTGANNSVYALAVSGSDLYAGGAFTTIGGVSASRIARWNGSTWSALGSGTGGGSFPDVNVLLVNGSDLYVGGRFLTVGGIASPFIAGADLGVLFPSVVSGSAASITSGGATLNGTVNPNGQATTAFFEYGTTTAYGSIASVTLSPDDGTADQSVSAVLSGLTINTEYHFRLVAIGPSGVSRTAEGTFTTLAVAGPEIDLEQPSGTHLVDGSASIGFGAVAVGSSSSEKTFTIRNAGSSTLSGITVTKNGLNNGDFIINTFGMISTLAPGDSMTFTVTFIPGATGLRNAAFHVSSNDPDENPFDVALSGTGYIPAPDITVEQPSDTGLTDGAGTVIFNVPTGDPVVKTFTIKNDGTALLNGLVITKNGVNASNFTVGPLGVTALGPGESATFTVSFDPPDSNTRTAALHIASNDADENPFDINLAGGAIQAAYQQGANDPFTAAGYAGTEDVWLFNNIEPNGVDENTGGDTRLIVGGAGGSAYRHGLLRFNVGSLAGNISSVHSLRLRLYFSGANANSGTLQVFAVAPANAGWIEGNGTTGSASQNGWSTWSARVYHPTTPTAWAGSAGASTPDSDYINTVLASVPYTTAASGDHIDLEFTDPSIINAWLGGNNSGLYLRTVSQDNEVIFHSSESAVVGMRPELMVGYLPPAEIAVEQPVDTELTAGVSTVNFGSALIGVTTVQRTFTIRNTGQEPLNISNVLLSGIHAGDYILDSAAAGTSLSPGGSTTVSVTFNPFVEGVRTTALRIISNDSDEGIFDINLTGTGTFAPEIVVEEPAGADLAAGVSSVAFGNAIAGVATVQKTFTIRNAGNLPLHISGVATNNGDSGDFVVNTGSMATTVSPGSTTSFTVTYGPSAAGTRSTSLQIASDDSDEGTFEVSLTGNGLAPQFGSIAFQDAQVIVNESLVTLNIPIVRTVGTDGPVSVRVNSTSGTATAADYNVVNNVVVPFAHGDGLKTVPVTILNDALAEGNETFTLTLSNVQGGAVLGAQTTITIRIIDPDATPPGVTITSPVSAAVVNVNAGGTVNITGTATDNKGVNKVQVSINGGSYTDAVLTPAGSASSLSTNYTVAMTPQTGANTVSVKSIDHRNNSSTIATRSFTVYRPLVVNADASLGTVSAGFSPSSFRQVGKSLTITATPKPPTTTPAFAGAIFTGWTVTGATNAQLGIAESTKEKQTLTFIFREDMTLTANFQLNPFGPMAGSYNGLIRPSATLPDRPNPQADGTVRSNATEGSFKATVQNSGAFSGTLTIDGLTLGVAGAFDKDGNARFGTARLLTQAVARANKPSLIVALHLDMVTPGVNDKIIGTVTSTDFRQSVTTAVSDVDSDRAYYNGTTQVVPAIYLGAASANGTFTAVFPARAVANQTAGYSAQDYPQGDGTGTISVTKSGVVSVAGTLADGTAISASSALSQANTFPLFAQLYNKLGFLSGFVQLDNGQPASDMAAAVALQWLRPLMTTTQYYPYGWPEGIRVDLMAAKYAAVAGQSVLKAANGANLQAADGDGNVTVTFSDGKLSETLLKAANLSVADMVTKVPDNDPTYTMTINRTTGAVSGTIAHTDDTVPTFNAIIYQKGPNAGAYGYFLTKQPLPIDYTGESGGVTLIGAP